MYICMGHAGISCSSDKVNTFAWVTIIKSSKYHYYRTLVIRMFIMFTEIISHIRTSVPLYILSSPR